MFTFSEMLPLVESESSFGAYVCHRRPGGYRATSDLVSVPRVKHSTDFSQTLFSPLKISLAIPLPIYLQMIKVHSPLEDCSTPKRIAQLYEIHPDTSKKLFAVTLSFTSVDVIIVRSSFRQ